MNLLREKIGLSYELHLTKSDMKHQYSDDCTLG